MQQEKLNRTRSAFLWTRILSTPFYVLYTLLPYILYKDVGASLLEVTTFIVLKPACSLIAPYWSVWIVKRPNKMIANLAWANILKFLPFLLIPFIDSVAYFTLASLIYIILGRGVMPAWIEILKLNIPNESRAKIFGYGQAFDYLGIALFPLLFGWMLDSYHESWRLLFSGAAIVGILSTWFLWRLPQHEIVEMTPAIQKQSIGESLLASLKSPWIVSLDLLKKRSDFARFQMGFMLGGSGLIILNPALPVFFNDTLHLSYKETCLAIAFCKGIGYAAATPFWIKKFEQLDIFRFCTYVTFLAALFPLVLYFAEWHLSLLWVAYLGYGIMQAGSELSWNLSGPTFSMEKDSSLYSQTNIVTQGIRGAIVPYLGFLLCQTWGATSALAAASLLCLVATYQMGKERYISYPARTRI